MNSRSRVIMPIAVWWLLAQATPATSTPAVLHALNVTLHGINTMLVGVIAARLTTSRGGESAHTTDTTLTHDGHDVKTPGFVFVVIVDSSSIVVSAFVTGVRRWNQSMRSSAGPEFDVKFSVEPTPRPAITWPS